MGSILIVVILKYQCNILYFILLIYYYLLLLHFTAPLTIIHMSVLVHDIKFTIKINTTNIFLKITQSLKRQL